MTDNPPLRWRQSDRNFWVSWWHSEDLGAFTLYWPWWISGTRGEDDVPSICAGIRASSAEAAMEIVRNALDKKPEFIEWRFCQEKRLGWRPYSDRFQKADWMPEWIDVPVESE